MKPHAQAHNWRDELHDPRIVSKAFDRVAAAYDRYAALEQEVCQRLLERCEYQRREPGHILDLGCGTGQASQALKRKFRKSQVIALDLSLAMLGQSRRRSGLLHPLRLVCGNMDRMPLAEQSLDLVFSNLALHWSSSYSGLMEEIRRVLRPDGMLLFTALGPLSFAELGQAWGAVDTTVSPQSLPDLLAWGDLLMGAGFAQPVMDVQRITLQYASLEAMMEELESTGNALLAPYRPDWASVAADLARTWPRRSDDGRIPLGFEVVFGTAFGPPEGQPRKTADGDVATFSVDGLLKTRRLR